MYYIKGLMSEELYKINTEITRTIITLENSKDMALCDIKLPNQWILYIYDKQVFKKIANKANFQAKPHRELCTIDTVSDLIYILQLMKVKCDSKLKIDSTESKINLDSNDYIIMRKGIEPIWEDVKNSNGGTFTIKMNHDNGYDVWSYFVMYMLGESLTEDMEYINGITVSYIPNSYNFNNPTASNDTCSTYIKIWDGKADRTRDQFVNILPTDILNYIKNESLMYTPNNKKKDFNEKNILTKLNKSDRFGQSGRSFRGGFSGNRRR